MKTSLEVCGHLLTEVLNLILFPGAAHPEGEVFSCLNEAPDHRQSDGPAILYDDHLPNERQILVVSVKHPTLFITV